MIGNSKTVKNVCLELKNVLDKELKDVPVCVSLNDLRAGFSVRAQHGLVFGAQIHRKIRAPA